MNSDEAYRAGLQDVMDERPSLGDTLSVAGEHELLLWYMEGRLVGERLLADEEIFI